MKESYVVACGILTRNVSECSRVLHPSNLWFYQFSEI